MSETVIEKETDDLDLDATVEPAVTEEKPAVEPTAMEKAVQELATTNKAILETVTKKPDPVEKKMTPEEEKEFWAIYDPEQTNKEFFRQWFRLNPEATEEEVKTAKQMFGDVQHGLVKQAVKGSTNYTNHALNKLREELKPLQEYVTKSQQAETKRRFYEGYPALKDKKFDKIVAAAATGLANKEFNNDEEYFKALADSAAEAITGLIPDFDLGKEPEKPAGKAPKLPRTSVGGGGGAGSGRTSGPVASTDAAADVFDD